MENTTTGAASDTAAAPEIAEHILAALKPDSVITTASDVVDRAYGPDVFQERVSAVLIDDVPVADFAEDDAAARELADALRKRQVADRIAALIDAVRAFNAPGLPTTAQFNHKVHAEATIWHLSDEDIVAALDTLGVEYEQIDYGADPPARDEAFTVWKVDLGDYDDGRIALYGQSRPAPKATTFGDYLAENAASFTEVQS